MDKGEYKQLILELRASSPEEADSWGALFDEFTKFTEGNPNEICAPSGLPQEFIGQVVRNFQRHPDSDIVSISVQFGIWIGQRIAVAKAISNIQQ